MSEIFEMINKIFNFKFPVPLNFITGEYVYISLFGTLCVFFILFIIGYIIKKLFI